MGTKLEAARTPEKKRKEEFTCAAYEIEAPPGSGPPSAGPPVQVQSVSKRIVFHSFPILLSFGWESSCLYHYASSGLFLPRALILSQLTWKLDRFFFLDDKTIARKVTAKRYREKKTGSRSTRQKGPPCEKMSKKKTRHPSFIFEKLSRPAAKAAGPN